MQSKFALNRLILDFIQSRIHLVLFIGCSVSIYFTAYLLIGINFLIQRITRFRFFNDIEDKKSFEFNAGISEEEIWELLSVASPRPRVPTEFAEDTFDRSSIRLATWNLTGFNSDKASNPGVMEVVCRTILENRYVGLSRLNNKYYLYD